MFTLSGTPVFCWPSALCLSNVLGLILPQLDAHRGHLPDSQAGGFWLGSANGKCGWQLRVATNLVLGEARRYPFSSPSILVDDLPSGLSTS